MATDSKKSDELSDEETKAATHTISHPSGAQQLCITFKAWHDMVSETSPTQNANYNVVQEEEAGFVWH